MRLLSVIDAPSDLGLRPSGVALLPAALREAGLLEGIEDVHHAGRVPVPAYDSIRDTSTGVLNSPGIRSFTARLAERVTSSLDLGRFPLVLGGDCSILLGALLSLRRRGRFGLFFVDGHADFYSPESEPNGEVASMDLAVATGRGPAELANIDGLSPLVDEKDVVVFGIRDADIAAAYGSPDVRQTEMHVTELAAIRRSGAAEAAREGIQALAGKGIEGFWVHLDADVLDDNVMPAVDYRMPGGLSPDELLQSLAVILASPFAVGMDVTIYNPELDDDERSAGRVLAKTLAIAFASAT